MGTGLATPHSSSRPQFLSLSYVSTLSIFPAASPSPMQLRHAPYGRAVVHAYLLYTRSAPMWSRLQPVARPRKAFVSFLVLTFAWSSALILAAVLIPSSLSHLSSSAVHRHSWSLWFPIFSLSLWSRRTSLASTFIYRHLACLFVGGILSQHVSPWYLGPHSTSMSSFFSSFQFNPRYSSIIIFGPGLSSFYTDYYTAAWRTNFHHGQRTFCMAYELSAWSMKSLHAPCFIPMD